VLRSEQPWQLSFSTTGRTVNRHAAYLSLNHRYFTVQRTVAFAVPLQGHSKFAKAEFEGAATCDLGVLEHLAIQHLDCNWALLTGQASGVFVCEVDSTCGRTALHALNEGDWDCEETLQAKAGDTWYAFFRWPVGLTLCNKVLAPGLRIHGEDDFVLIPPSKHRSGVSHTYLDPEAWIATAPKWLLELAFKEPAGQSSGKILPFPMPPQR
jgi:hypothetical protein